MINTTILSSKGQVVIPADIRQKLGLEKQTRLTVRIQDGEIVLAPEQQADQPQKSLRGILKGGRSLTECLEQERKRDKAQEERQAESFWTRGPSSPGSKTKNPRPRRSTSS